MNEITEFDLFVFSESVEHRQGTIPTDLTFELSRGGDVG